MCDYRPPKASSKVSSDKDCRAFGSTLNLEKYKKKEDFFIYSV